MAAAFRRVVLKPPGLTDEQTAQLRADLETCVEQQAELASRSRHVVNFTGPLEETESCFTIEHEPGRAIPTQSLLDQNASRVAPQELLSIAIALMDSLRAGISANGGKTIVHGGICGGVLLQTPDGAWRVSDFGMAPAICAALGPEQYIELAVAGDVELDAPRKGTAVWEIVPADDENRDDRLCGFVDPHKYATDSLAIFEPRSDIISCGILLHLLAEHRHPLLPGANEHRLSAMAESMAWQAFKGPRQKKLANSSDPAIQRWCELVDLTLSRAPEQRPDANEVIKRLKEVEVEPIAIPGQATSTVEEDKESSGPAKRKRSLALPLTAVLVLGSAIGIWLGVSRETDQDSMAANVNATVPPIIQQTRAPVESVVLAVRDILAQSQFLDDANLKTLVTTQDDGSTGDLEIQYIIPGLASSTSPLQIPEPELGNPWEIPETMRSELAEESSSLDRLLGDDVEAHMTQWAQQNVSTSSTASFVILENIRARIPSPPTWLLDDGRWLASDTKLKIILEYGTDQSEILPILETAVELIAENGEVRATLSGSSAALDAQFNDSIRMALISQQTQSQETHLVRLDTELSDVSPQLASDPSYTDALAPDLPITVDLAGIAQREVVLGWNPVSISFDADPSEAEVIAGFRSSWRKLSALNEEIQSNREHWLHESYRGGFSGRIIETSPPLEGRWTLAVPPPWAFGMESNQTQESTVKLPLEILPSSSELEKPTYWPVITAYTQLTEQPFVISEPRHLTMLGVAVRASGSDAGTSLINYLDPQSPPQQVFPSFELAPIEGAGNRAEAAPVFRVGENALSGSLTVRTHGRFALRTTNQPSTNSSAKLNLQRVDQTVRALFSTPQEVGDGTNSVESELPSATLTFTVDSSQPDGIAVNFTELSNLATHLAANLPKVAALDGHIGTFATRAQIERELESRLSGSDGKLENAEAFAILKQVWRAKGVRAVSPGEDDLASFSKSRQRKLRSNMTKRRLVPTVFVEYFCGPGNVYAVVFSVAPTSSGVAIPEGAWLVRLCTIDDLSTEAALGDRLILAVLSKVPLAGGSPFGSPFSGRLGIILGLDTLLSSVLTPELSMSQPHGSYLEQSGELTTDASNLAWSSLDELRKSDQMGDFALVHNLVASRNADKGASRDELPTLLWVWRTLSDAIDAP